MKCIFIYIIFFVSVYVLCYVCVYVELFEIFGKKCIRNRFVDCNNKMSN